MDKETQKINADSDPVSNKREEEISLILKLLENRIDEFKHDIDLSKELLGGGVKTGLINDIEKTIENPLSQLLSLREKLDFELKDFAKNIIKALLKRKKELIKEVYRCESFENESLYCIVLSEDNIENRESIFEVLDVYDTILSNNLYPVSFQFIPENLRAEINYIEKISLEEQ